MRNYLVWCLSRVVLNYHFHDHAVLHALFHIGRIAHRGIFVRTAQAIRSSAEPRLDGYGLGLSVLGARAIGDAPRFLAQNRE